MKQKGKIEYTPSKQKAFAKQRQREKKKGLMDPPNLIKESG